MDVRKDYLALGRDGERKVIVEPARGIELVDAAGRPFAVRGPEAVVGRGAGCDVLMPDPMVSRRHFALHYTPAGWQIEDLNSTGGTLLNGRRLPPGRCVPLTQSDKITAGGMTLRVKMVGPPAAPLPAVVRPAVQPPAAQPGHAAEYRAVPRGPAAIPAAAAAPAWRWPVAAAVLAGAGMAAAGAFLPWIKVTLTWAPEELLEQVPGGDLISQAAKTVGELAKPFLPSTAQGQVAQVLNPAPVERVIGGMDNYGVALLAAAAVVVVLVICDLAFRLNRSSLPGVIYILAAVVPAILMANDAMRFYRLGRQEILFGVRLQDLLQGAGKLTDTRVDPLPGLYLTGVGLLVLLVAGIARSFLPLSSRHLERG